MNACTVCRLQWMTKRVGFLSLQQGILVSATGRRLYSFTWYPRQGRSISSYLKLRKSRKDYSQNYSKYLKGDGSGIIQQWTGHVAKFGCIRIETGARTVVQPIDPMAVREGDEAIITLIGDEVTELREEANKKYPLEKFITLNNDRNCLKVKFLDDKKNSLLSSMVLHIQIPFPYDVEAFQYSQEPIHVERLENDKIFIKSQLGDITYKNLKTSDVEFCTGGKIQADGYILGNAHLRVHGSGSIDVKKLQGSKLKLSTISGHLSAAALYSQAIECQTESGNISLHSSHGNMTCKTSDGVVEVGSVSGCADIKTGTGNITVTLDKADYVSGESEKGSLTIFSQFRRCSTAVGSGVATAAP